MAATSLGRVAVGLLLSSALAPAAAQQRPEGVMSDAIAQRVIAAWGAQRVVIIVKVSDGVVELWGEALSAAAAAEAERIARGTAGVRAVISYLSVNAAAAL